MATGLFVLYLNDQLFIQEAPCHVLPLRKHTCSFVIVEQITCIFGVNRANCDTSTKVGMGHIYGH